MENKRNSWWIRLYEEYKSSTSAYFITLTYADNYYHNSYEFAKRDIQLFIKKVRNKSSRKIRYYSVSERGTKTKRIHHHIVIFNLDGSFYNVVRDSWMDGFIHIVRVNIKLLKYITKYHVLRSDDEGSFVLMSKGIGRGYVNRMRKFHDGNINTNYYPYFQFKMGLPRYYKDKLFTKEEKEEIAQKVPKNSNLETLDDMLNDFYAVKRKNENFKVKFNKKQSL